MPDEETPKIIVDDDWKSQAQAEKARLKQEEAAPAPKSGGEDGIPEQPTFDDLMRLMATQALMYMGAFPDPQTGKAMIALDMAKVHIDMLGVLEEKTKGNLTEEESKAISSVVRELRLQFVEINKAVAQAQAEGKLETQPPPGAGPVPPSPPGV